jgi:hypothetical protein
LVCKIVALREGMSGGHNCSIPDTGDRHYHPYGGSPRAVRMRLGITPGDVPQSSQLNSLTFSPAPAEITPTEDESREGAKAGSADEGDLSQPEVPDSDSLFGDPELPTLLQILHGEA